MEIDLSVLEEVGSVEKVDSEIGFKDLSFRNREIKIPELLLLKLDIYKTDDSFVFSGNLKGKLVLECSRCLKPFPYSFDIEINKEIEEKDIEDLKHFDLNQMLNEDIFMTVPIKPLCSEDCEGICPECGQNLNEEECGCETESIDPRLAKLNDFYNDDNE